MFDLLDFHRADTRPEFLHRLSSVNRGDLIAA